MPVLVETNKSPKYYYRVPYGNLNISLKYFILANDGETEQAFGTAK